MDRKEFQDILESIKIPEGTLAEDLQRLVSPLNKALLQMAPERLFKYRSCCDNHISAFEKDEVWMSTSDLFNDPFDTLIQFDEKELRSACDAMSNPEIVYAMTKYFAEGGQIAPQINHLVDKNELASMRQLATDALAKGMIKPIAAEQMNVLKLMMEFYIALFPQVVQRFSTVVCFSERVDSILMWSHYADNHKGFALGYDLRPYLQLNSDNLGLFPVVYSEKRYDASEFLYWLLCGLLKIPAHNQDIMSSIKLLLYKSLDWSYEQEWRLIKTNNKDFFKEKAEPIICRPNSIYYGCRISDSNRERLHRIAISKGIEEHVMSVNNAADIYRVDSVAFTEK